MPSLSARPSAVKVTVIATAVAAVLLSGGCSWFNKRGNGYAQNPRPLEVPPDLAAAKTPAVAGSVLASEANNTSAAFQVPGTRDEVFARVDTALSKIPGVKFESKAQSLGLFDLTLSGVNVLIRITEQNGQSLISAVDSRGQSSNSEAVSNLLRQIRANLGE